MECDEEMQNLKLVKHNQCRSAVQSFFISNFSHIHVFMSSGQALLLFVETKYLSKESLINTIVSPLILFCDNQLIESSDNDLLCR